MYVLLSADIRFFFEVRKQGSILKHPERIENAERDPFCKQK